MKLFVDTANLEELEQCLRRGFPSGVTTNPSILSKERETLLQAGGVPPRAVVASGSSHTMLLDAQEGAPAWPFHRHS